MHHMTSSQCKAEPQLIQKPSTMIWKNLDYSDTTIILPVMQTFSKMSYKVQRQGIYVPYNQEVCPSSISRSLELFHPKCFHDWTTISGFKECHS